MNDYYIWYTHEIEISKKEEGITISKKVKCKDCSNSMGWSLPIAVNHQNYEYAKIV